MFPLYSRLTAYSPLATRIGHIFGIGISVCGLVQAYEDNIQMNRSSAEQFRKRNELLSLIEEQIDEWKAEVKVPDEEKGALTNFTGVKLQERQDRAGETCSNNVLLFRWLETLKNLNGKKSLRKEERKYTENKRRVDLKLYECMKRVEDEESDERVGVALDWDVRDQMEYEELRKKMKAKAMESEEFRKNGEAIAMKWAEATLSIIVLSTLLSMKESGAEMLVPFDWVRMTLDEWKKMRMH